MAAVKALPILGLLLFITAAESFLTTVANDWPNIAVMALIGFAFNFASFVVGLVVLASALGTIAGAVVA